MDKTTFIKTDENRIVNEKYIRWVKKVNECMELCCKFDGCNTSSLANKNTISVCKINSPDSYKKLNKHFDDSYT